MKSPGQKYRPIWKTISSHLKFYSREGTVVGGFWERMVGITKQCLRKTMGDLYNTLTFEELLTIIVEIDGTVDLPV